MKINIIGGSGFIGTNLTDAMINDWTILNLDKALSSKYDHLTVKVDICNNNEIQNNMRLADWVILLAAEHRDDVSPISLYYKVNVEGTANVLKAMNRAGIKKIIFTSSVAVYGLNKDNPDEYQEVDPFNHYGKSKWEAEEVLRTWYREAPEERTLIIIRPTVVFGPGNKGNVYNLLNQISSGKFLMIGDGNNKKSMAFVENITAFIKFCIVSDMTGYHLFNYADKPDMTTNELVSQAEKSLDRKILRLRIPYFIGYIGGLSLDIIAKVLRMKFSISAVRIKKFCATTQFSAEKVRQSGFKAPFSLDEGLNKTILSILKRT
ncbi:NAD-dependent epimerase/dehydratase family protein [Chitinophaga lutea]|uniref:NAD-dependent epimerase/dehydratase family protein n=1 Tax=Chitinophaga lutea TaxID=2488634 RepID=A0A3N4PWZ5_9BACT|nr:NAD-dependent epimerase/dehydratase family protein [Chitinophaga lutea]RPE13242.1 NAD-dependent epimerase/dehydratase family protein [Chitinophaga lutea]